MPRGQSGRSQPFSRQFGPGSNATPGADCAWSSERFLPGRLAPDARATGALRAPALRRFASRRIQ
eukprot:8159898-Lingulodinium_polyedra.AAC.1